MRSDRVLLVGRGEKDNVAEQIVKRLFSNFLGTVGERADETPSKRMASFRVRMNRSTTAMLPSRDRNLGNDFNSALQQGINAVYACVGFSHYREVLTVRRHAHWSGTPIDILLVFHKNLSIYQGKYAEAITRHVS